MLIVYALFALAGLIGSAIAYDDFKPPARKPKKDSVAGQG